MSDWSELASMRATDGLACSAGRPGGCSQSRDRSQNGRRRHIATIWPCHQLPMRRTADATASQLHQPRNGVSTLG